MAKTLTLSSLIPTVTDTKRASSYDLSRCSGRFYETHVEGFSKPQKLRLSYYADKTEYVVYGKLRKNNKIYTFTPVHNPQYWAISYDLTQPWKLLDKSDPIGKRKVEKLSQAEKKLMNQKVLDLVSLINRAAIREAKERWRGYNPDWAYMTIGEIKDGLFNQRHFELPSSGSSDLGENLTLFAYDRGFYEKEKTKVIQNAVRRLVKSGKLAEILTTSPYSGREAKGYYNPLIEGIL